MGKTGRTRTLARTAILIAGTALLLGGVLRGEYAVTLNKAVHICLECIGIG